MTSQKQITANRRNGKKSTGPKTEIGKTRCKRNALNHGLRAIGVLTPDEDPGAYDELRQKLRMDVAPVGCAETQLVERIAACLWRLWRCARIEAKLLRILRRSASSFEESLLATIAPEIASKREKEKTSFDYDIGLAFSGDPFDNDALGKLCRYEASLDRMLYRALHELQRLQAARKGDVVSAPAALDVNVSLGK